MSSNTKQTQGSRSSGTSGRKPLTASRANPNNSISRALKNAAVAIDSKIPVFTESVTSAPITKEVVPPKMEDLAVSIDFLKSIKMLRSLLIKLPFLGNTEGNERLTHFKTLASTLAVVGNSKDLIDPSATVGKELNSEILSRMKEFNEGVTTLEALGKEITFETMEGTFVMSSEIVEFMNTSDDLIKILDPFLALIEKDFAKDPLMQAINNLMDLAGNTSTAEKVTFTEIKTETVVTEEAHPNVYLIHKNEAEAETELAKTISQTEEKLITTMRELMQQVNQDMNRNQEALQTGQDRDFKVKVGAAILAGLGIVAMFVFAIAK